MLHVSQGDAAMTPPDLDGLLAAMAEEHADFELLTAAYHDKCAELKRAREDLRALASKYHVDDKEKAP